MYKDFSFVSFSMRFRGKTIAEMYGKAETLPPELWVFVSVIFLLICAILFAYIRHRKATSKLASQSELPLSYVRRGTRPRPSFSSTSSVVVLYPGKPSKELVC